jgi:tetratricopeptide (TPR) repeat protein
MKMKIRPVFFALLGYLLFSGSFSVLAQDPESMMSEAKALERKFLEDSALGIYKQAFSLQPSNLQAAIKCAELSGNMGRRASGTIRISAWMNQAQGFAEAALRIDSNSADALTAMAQAARNFAETEEKKDKATDYLRKWRSWSEKALEKDSAHARASYQLGRWHLEVLTQGGFRKATGKLLYGGLPEANIDSAVALMEFCKEKEPYFCANFLDLAKAYHYKLNYEKAIQVLERLVKLPTRRQDDVEIKAEGKEFLQKLQ